MGQSIYDDTGRGPQSLEDHKKLLKRIELKENVREYLTNPDGLKMKRKKKKDRESLRDPRMASMGGSHAFQASAKAMLQTPPTSAHGTTHQTSMYGGMGQDEEALARAEARKIGPFCFDVDNDIETEVLVNE